jgi:hypothetical protein
MGQLRWLIWQPGTLDHGEARSRQSARQWVVALRRRLWSGLLMAALVLAACATPGRPEGNPLITARGVWIQLPAGPLSARREVAGGWLDQKFVLVGGWSDRPCPPSAGCVPPEKPALRDGASFDPSSAGWRRIADAPVPVSGRNTVVVDGKLYLLTVDISHADSPASFLAYDPSRDSWATLRRPPGDGLELLVAGNQILAVSYSDERSPAVDSVFDRRSQTWRRLPRDPLGQSYGRSAIWLGDHLLLSAMNFGPNPEGGDEPMPDPQLRLRLASLSADFSRWTLLPDSDLKDCNLVAVAGRVVCPF